MKVTSWHSYNHGNLLHDRAGISVTDNDDLIRLSLTREPRPGSPRRLQHLQINMTHDEARELIARIQETLE